MLPSIAPTVSSYYPSVLKYLEAKCDNPSVVQTFVALSYSSIAALYIRSFQFEDVGLNGQKNKGCLNKFVNTTYVARRLVSARLVVTDTLLARFRSNSADTPSYRVALATKNACTLLELEPFI